MSLFSYCGHGNARSFCSGRYSDCGNEGAHNFISRKIKRAEESPESGQRGWLLTGNDSQTVRT